TTRNDTEFSSDGKRRPRITRRKRATEQHGTTRSSHHTEKKATEHTAKASHGTTRNNTEFSSHGKEGHGTHGESVPRNNTEQHGVLIRRKKKATDYTATETTEQHGIPGEDQGDSPRRGCGTDLS